MRFINGSTLRRLIPAGAVCGVLALSYAVQVPSLASNNDVGYGYANNCGVKGSGFHDHGKACPNRPFPGKGKGVLEKLSGGLPSSATTEENATTTSSTDTDQPEVTSAATATSDETLSFGGHHGHGHGHGHEQGT